MSGLSCSERADVRHTYDDHAEWVLAFAQAVATIEGREREAALYAEVRCRLAVAKRRAMRSWMRDLLGWLA